MAHIFISYSRNERDTAAKLAERLTEAGYDVWWDAALLGGTRFEDEISNVLREAKVAIILWSKSAASSDWVRAEAEIARHQKSALPVLIDDVEIASLPILFQQIHIIDLKGWDGNPRADGYQQILKSVIGRVGDAAGPKRSAPEAQARLAQASDEAVAWSELTGMKDAAADDYESFLKRFPSGQFATLAEMRLERLERRSGRRRRNTAMLVAAVALLAVVIALAFPQVRNPLLNLIGRPAAPPVVVATCAPGNMVHSQSLPFQFCLDGTVWHQVTVPDNTALFYVTNDNSFSLMLNTTPVSTPPDQAKPLIITNTDAGAPGAKTVLTGESTRTINGLQWTVWTMELSGGDYSTTRYLHYYYARPGLGTVQLTVYTTYPADTLPPYGDAIIESAKFD